MEPRRDVFEPLNGLRGIAALCVVIFHASAIMGRQLAPRGYLAVDLFFVLSGFVIAHAYERRFTRGLGAIQFFWRRVKRFYPLYFTGLVLGTSVMAMDILNPPGPMSWREYGAAVLAGAMFLPLPMRDLYPLNVPSWSLLCELAINLIYRLMWRSSLALAILAGASWLLLLGRPIDHADLLTGMLRAAFSFAIGALLYRHRLPLPKVPGWLVIAALAAVLMTPFPDLLAITVVFPIGIALLAHCEDAPGFKTLGQLSFPLYAIHWPIIQFGLGLSHRLSINPLLQGWAWIIFSVGAAWVADRWIDRPERLFLSATAWAVRNRRRRR